MITRKNLQISALTCMLVTLIGISHPIHAAPLSFPNEPLSLGIGTQPNIFFAIDDSGSMNWDELLNAGTWSPGAAITGRFTYWITRFGCCGTAWDREFRRLTCRGYNVMAYDPNVTYTKWFGVDSNNAAYQDQTLAAARFNPYFTSAINISNHIYFPWNDADGDNEYDAEPVQFQAPANATDECGDVSSNANGVVVNTLSAAQQTNYANWYSYYRKRDYVMKRALSELITNSGARMGLATLNDNNTVGTPVSDMLISANKDTLMSELFQVLPSGLTPLRLLLRNVGRYFDDTNSDSHAELGFTTASPIQSQADGGECQQNFTVLLSDGFWNGPTSPAVGNEDADGTGTDTQWDGGPHADGLADTLADVAMKFYETDLSSLADKIAETVVNGVVVDSNPAQHLVTYAVAFGLTGNAVTTPPNHDSTTPPPSNPPWPAAIAPDSKETLDDMQHAAFNGRGLFLNAADPQDLIDSLNDAFADIELRIGQSGTSVAINSTVLKTTSRVFQATYSTVDWSGELSAFNLNSVGEAVQPAVWTANSKLPLFDATAASPSQTTRKIFTTLGNSVIAFDDSNATLATAVDATNGVNIINYLRGDTSNEVRNGGILRNRSLILADIISSSPISAADDDFVYTNLPNPFSSTNPSPEGPLYKTYLSTKKDIFNPASGSPFSMVYVGGNDGMLHAFRDTQDTNFAGREEFAYIPSVLHGALADLADPNYMHRNYVDAGPFVADAFFDHDNNNSTDPEWRTVLVGSLGSGGRTVYALDVTAPLNFAAGDVMWEYTSADNAELGLIFSQPQIVRLNRETANNSETARYGVIFGNGYNSVSQTARLIILDVEDGSEIAVLDTGVGNASNPNGLAMPYLLDENGDGTVDIAYAGDLQGNLWKFDISAKGVGNPGNAWRAINFGTNNNPAALYQALDGDGTAQPITTRPVLVNHPDSGFVVLFGTGKYIEIGDNVVGDNPQVQTFYGIRDKNTGSTSGNNSDQIAAGRGDLVEQQILNNIDVFADLNDPATPSDPSDDTLVNTARVVSENTVDYTSKDGWFIDLLTPPPNAPVAEGERVVANPLTRFGRAIFNTFIPISSPCDAGGLSVLMELDAINGGRLENSVFDLNNDGIIDARDFVGYGSTQVPASGIFIPGTLASPSVLSADDASVEYKLTSGISGEVTTTKESIGGSTVGRQSWRQIR